MLNGIAVEITAKVGCKKKPKLCLRTVVITAVCVQCKQMLVRYHTSLRIHRRKLLMHFHQVISHNPHQTDMFFATEEAFIFRKLQALLSAERVLF